MVSLDLRFTAAGTSGAPPDLAAFRGVDRALLREQQADHDDVSALADLIAANIVATRLRIVADAPGRRPVFVPLRSAGIPAIDLDPAPPITAAFVLTDQVRGHFAWPAPTPRRTSRTGAALVLAACIPLALPDVALAQEPATAPTITPPAPVVVAPPLTHQAKLETILRAMNGRDAIVFAAGTTVTGRIIGVDGDFVTMVDIEREGKIAMIPKPQITEVRGVVAARPDKLPTGTSQLIAGGVLVGVGTPLMIAGLTLLSFSPSSFFFYGFELIPAVVLLGIGIPHLVIGKRRQRAYRAARDKPQISRRLLPSVARTPGGGWTGGLSFRF